MTTAAWSFNIDHNSDAGYRAWVQDFIDHCIAVGLTRTADTGQFANSAETKPATNTVTHKAVFVMDSDAVHGTAPIYIIFTFGTSTSSTRIRIDMQIGPSTDGASAMTGTAKTTQRRCDGAGGGFTGVTAYNSWMCYVDGCFWFVHARNHNGSSSAANAGSVTRTCDSSGVPTAEGAVQLCYPNGAAGDQSVRFAATAAAYTAHGGDINSTCYMALVNMIETSTLVGGVPQMFPLLSYSPGVFPLFSCGVVKSSEAAEADTLSWTPFGSTSRDYICIGKEMGSPWQVTGGGTASNYNLAFIWE